jgi:1,2-phenylacetyl-CoA epoxidase PaaB subunit
MKADKTLKRLTKIEELMSDVTKRYSAGAPSIREALQDAKDAVTRAKDAVSLHVSSGAATKSTAGPPNARRKLIAAETPVKKQAPKKGGLKKRW